MVTATTDNSGYGMSGLAKGSEFCIDKHLHSVYKHVELKYFADIICPILKI
jgi:hypothetical protein